MRARTETSGRCARCGLRPVVCLCAELPRVDTRARFVVLRHALEAWKTTNTGLLATLALPNSELLEHGAAGRGDPTGALDLRGACVLFPGPERSVPEPAPRLVIVPDGTWQQARRMVQRVPAIRALPRLSLPSPAFGSERPRRAHFAEGMSTLEAIARAVAALEGDDVAKPLDELHARVVQRLRESKGR